MNLFHREITKLLLEQDKRKLREYFYKISHDFAYPSPIKEQVVLIYHWLDKELADIYKPEKPKTDPSNTRYNLLTSLQGTNSDFKSRFWFNEKHGVPPFPPIPLANNPRSGKSG